MKKGREGRIKMTKRINKEMVSKRRKWRSGNTRRKRTRIVIVVVVEVYKIVTLVIIIEEREVQENIIISSY